MKKKVEVTGRSLEEEMKKSAELQSHCEHLEILLKKSCEEAEKSLHEENQKWETRLQQERLEEMEAKSTELLSLNALLEEQLKESEANLSEEKARSTKFESRCELLGFQLKELEEVHKVNMEMRKQMAKATYEEKTMLQSRCEHLAATLHDEKLKSVDLLKKCAQLEAELKKCFGDVERSALIRQFEIRLKNRDDANERLLERMAKLKGKRQLERKFAKELLRRQVGMIEDVLEEMEGLNDADRQELYQRFNLMEI